eukprot:47893_1
MKIIQEFLTSSVPQNPLQRIFKIPKRDKYYKKHESMRNKKLAESNDDSEELKHESEESKQELNENKQKELNAQGIEWAMLPAVIAAILFIISLATSSMYTYRELFFNALGERPNYGAYFVISALLAMICSFQLIKTLYKVNSIYQKAFAIMKMPSKINKLMSTLNEEVNIDVTCPKHHLLSKKTQDQLGKIDQRYEVGYFCNHCKLPYQFDASYHCPTCGSGTDDKRS